MAAGRSSTGISPRPMLMGAPHDALRASNAGVSLRVPVVMTNRVPLCFGTTPVSLLPAWEIMAGAVLWLAPARTYLSALFRAAIAALFNVQHRLLISLHQPSSL